MSRSPQRVSRKVKLENNTTGNHPTQREKFMQSAQQAEQAERPIQGVKLEAKNANQKLALSMLKEGRSVVFLSGSAGTGKSMIACYHAAAQLKAKKVEKIYLVRPAVAVGKSIGLLPGDISLKLQPYFAQTLTHLSKFLGAGYLKYCLEKEIIQYQPAEFLRGISLEDCVCIIEESQNFTAEEFEMVLTRLGDNATLIFTGDQKQHDLRGVSGLEKTLDLFARMINEQPNYLLDDDLEQLSSNIGSVVFSPDDVVRSGLTKAFVKIYYNA